MSVSNLHFFILDMWPEERRYSTICIDECWPAGVVDILGVIDVPCAHTLGRIDADCGVKPAPSGQRPARPSPVKAALLASKRKQASDSANPSAPLVRQGSPSHEPPPARQTPWARPIRGHLREQESLGFG